jgi:hypothetical protein
MFPGYLFGSLASFETVVIPGGFYHLICYCNIFSSNLTIKFARFVYFFAVTLWSSLIERLSFSVLSCSHHIFLLEIYGISLSAKCFKIKQCVCYTMSFLKPYFLLLLHICIQPKGPIYFTILPVYFRARSLSLSFSLLALPSVHLSCNLYHMAS